MNALAARPSGPKPRKSETDKENERLRERAAKLERELARAKAALDITERAHGDRRAAQEVIDEALARLEPVVGITQPAR
ncbi:hypothetical protein [Sphaerisporangium dianthi]|uniref:Uncharacterized protein n=1 Tax=Sphaerisporangium dianthi TaxID=1436120 RepID=A0ABV9CMT2_9ACTN